MEPPEDGDLRDLWELWESRRRKESSRQGNPRDGALVYKSEGQEVLSPKLCQVLRLAAQVT